MLLNVSYIYVYIHTHTLKCMNAVVVYGVPVHCISCTCLYFYTIINKCCSLYWISSSSLNPIQTRSSQIKKKNSFYQLSCMQYPVYLCWCIYMCRICYIYTRITAYIYIYLYLLFTLAKSSSTFAPNIKL